MTTVEIAGIPIGEGTSAETAMRLKRFEARYVPEPNTGCWLWLGKIGKTGFPVLSLSKRASAYANRFAYVAFIGPIPDDAQLKHKCGIKICVNPQHLEPQTDENMKRRGVERFKQSYRVDPATGCWLWTGFLRNGYGGLVYGRKNGAINIIPAHRFSYEFHVGPIAQGMCIDHLCRRPSCVNPLHLEVVTLVENVLRGVSRHAVNARKTHCVLGHEFTTENTYRSKTGYRQCRRCAALRAAGYRDSKRKG